MRDDRIEETIRVIEVELMREPVDRRDGKPTGHGQIGTTRGDHMPEVIFPVLPDEDQTLLPQSPLYMEIGTYLRQGLFKAIEGAPGEVFIMAEYGKVEGTDGLSQPGLFLILLDSLERRQGGNRGKSREADNQNNNLSDFSNHSHLTDPVVLMNQFYDIYIFFAILRQRRYL